MLYSRYLRFGVSEGELFYPHTWVLQTYCRVSVLVIERLHEDEKIEGLHRMKSQLLPFV